MMKIQHLFDRDIFRPINGVVKADQLDDSSIWQELDEFVVTRELDQHFRRFFSAYGDAIQHPNDPDVSGKIGVWVSGFFGSGKSHLIKVLSYLLRNRTHTHNGESKQAVEFFENKIKDAMLFGDIKRAVASNTNVILFNIDSKADHRSGRDAILAVFLKVLNEMQGYSGDHPPIAHMERYLEGKGRLKQFHEAFRAATGSDWITERDAYHFHRDEVVKALAYLVQNTFTKMGYIKRLSAEPLKEIQAILRSNDIGQQTLALQTEEGNKQAIDDLRSYVELCTNANRQIVLHDMIEKRYTLRPYGWPDDEVVILVARLLVLGEISLMMDGALVPLDKAYEAITTPAKRRKIVVVRRQTSDPKALQNARSLGKELCHEMGLDGEDALFTFLQNKLKDWQSALHSYKPLADTGNYPGKDEINDGLVLVRKLLACDSSYKFIEQFNGQKAALLDVADQFSDLEQFYEHQKPTWEKLHKAYERFQLNRLELERDAQAGPALKRMQAIPTAVIANEGLFFRPGLTWSTVTVSRFSIRLFDEGFIFDNGGCCVFSDLAIRLYLLALLNSRVCEYVLEKINPTVNFQSGEVAKFPTYIDQRIQLQIDSIARQCVYLSRKDWDSFETSWDFKRLPVFEELLLADTCEVSSLTWDRERLTSIARLKELEQKNNQLLAESYGLQGEVDIVVVDSDVTLDRPDREEDIKRLISYAIGCMMGRYSLDKPGLIYAHSGNKGFDPSQYKTFPADLDGIIPSWRWIGSPTMPRTGSLSSLVWPGRRNT